MTHAEIVTDLIKKLKAEHQSTIAQFKNTARDDLSRFHHGLGTFIRNNYNLWEVPWEPEIVDGFDMSPYHPDAVSMTLIEQVWDKLHEEDQ